MEDNMEFNIVLNQVLILFIILIIGFIGGKSRILDASGTKKLSEIMLFVTSPMLVLKSFFIEFSKERLVNVLWMVGLAAVVFLFSITFSSLIYSKFNDKVSAVLRFTAIFSNCGYMGLPLLKALYGDDGVFYGSFYVVIFQIVLWTYGYSMFGGKGSGKSMIKKILTNPNFIAVYAGLCIFLFSIPIPEFISGAVKAVGDMTMPISMLIIGAVISTTQLAKVFSDWRVYMSSAVRLVVMPVIAIFATKYLGIPALPRAVIATALAMPSAANTTVFAEMFDKDAVFASKCVSVSTLLSILTAPVIISLI